MCVKYYTVGGDSQGYSGLIPKHPINNSASEASPTLRCSIEILGDICRSVGMSVVGQNAKAEIRGPNMRVLKVSLGRIKLTCDARIVYIRL